MVERQGIALPGRAVADEPTLLFEIGQFGRAHGVHGEVRMRFHSGNSDVLAHVTTLVARVRTGLRELDLAGWRPVPGGALVAIAGVGSREAAEALCNALVWAWRRDLPPPQAGEFYLADLLGARVLVGEAVVGEVIEIRSYPSVDVFVIREASGGLVEQPIVDEWFEDLDPEEKLVRLKSRDGLIQ